MKLSTGSCLLAFLVLAPAVTAGTVEVSVGPGGLLSFSPANVTIEVGDSVRWVWESDDHNVASGNPGGQTSLFTSGTPMDTGTMFEFVFDQAFLDANPVSGNVYNYICTPHQFFGMTGSVTVNVPPPTDPDFVRGDCNADGALNIADAIAGLGGLFGGETVECVDACDVNDDQGYDIADMIYLLSNLFSGGADPIAPFPGCGQDGTADSLGCAAFAACP